MQETIQIILSAETTRAVKNNTGDKLDLLFNELVNYTENIEAMLTAYHYASKNKVFDVKLLKSSVAIDNLGKGSVKVNYQINMFNGCADLSVDDNEKMTVSIRVDMETGECHLIGEYIPEREPDEL